MTTQNKPIQWDLLDIPEGAQYYQPKGTVSFGKDKTNEARFFRRLFTEVLVPHLSPNWLDAGHSPNWAGSIKIPEECINSNRILVLDGKRLYVPVGAAYFQKADSTDAGNPLRFFRNDFTEVFVPENGYTWNPVESQLDYESAITIAELRSITIQQKNSTDDLVVVDDLIKLEDPFKDQLKHSHYFRDVSKLDKIDIYMFLHLFNVTDPCLQHIIKKAACAGQRGAKDFDKDVKEICDTAVRLLEMREELK